jgi:hypothetical protein
MKPRKKTLLDNSHQQNDWRNSKLKVVLIGFAVFILMWIGMINELLVKASIDRSRAFLSLQEDLTEACAIRKPCGWMVLDVVREGMFASLADIETLRLGDDYNIVVSEDGVSVTAMPKGFFWGYAPSDKNVDRAYEVAAMSSDDFNTAPAIFTHY